MMTSGVKVRENGSTYRGGSLMNKTGVKVLKEAKKERVGGVDHENLGGSDDSFDVFQVDNNGSLAS